MKVLSAVGWTILTAFALFGITGGFELFRPARSEIPSASGSLESRVAELEANQAGMMADRSLALGVALGTKYYIQDREMARVLKESKEVLAPFAKGLAYSPQFSPEKLPCLWTFFHTGDVDYGSTIPVGWDDCSKEPVVLSGLED